ncbi:MAG: F0F1 ATP synthase subunit delta [Sphaerimonospora mesophila]
MHKSSRRQIAKFVAAQLVAGEPVGRIAKVLAAYLSSNRQTRYRELIIRDIEAELMNAYGHLSVDVTSARQLTSEVKTALVAMLRAETGAKTVELRERVDSDLLGGVVVRTPEAEMDASLRKKLTRLKAI